MYKKILILSLLVFLSHLSLALELPLTFGDGMVLQRDVTIPVWGWADKNSEVRINFNQLSVSVMTNSQGEWAVKLPAISAGGPYELSVENKDKTLTVKDIWMGDVWLCSGQSNMEWPLHSAENANKEIAEAKDTMIRHFKVPRSWASAPSDRLQGGDWQINSPDIAGSFTAVGYFFAKRIRQDHNVPIGLLNSTWGGSSIEAWMDAPLLGLDTENAQRELSKLEGQEEVVAEQVRERIRQWPNSLTNNYDSANADWSSEKLAVDDWFDLEAPSLWEQKYFTGLDGVAWYRKTFTLSKEEAAQDLQLNLARIDDHDISYVNGHKVGETNAYNRIRLYTVPKNILKAGTNTIAIRVLDTGGGGGIWSDPELLSIQGKNFKKSLAGTWKFKVDKGIVTLEANRNQTATALYNKMLHPLIKFPIKGVIWYQGESNAGNSQQALAYRDQFSAMIQDWRQKWGQAELPFYWVQLANFQTGNNSGEDIPWAILRESQTATLALPHTGEAVIIDVGDPEDIHPRDKLTVGNRLALHALKNEYGENIYAASPVFKSASTKKGKTTLKIQAGSKLKVNGKNALGFEIRDENGKWHQAKAKIKGKNVILTNKNVSQVVAVRYAWSDNPENANISDKAGLPLTPFRHSF